MGIRWQVFTPAATDNAADEQLGYLLLLIRHNDPAIHNQLHERNRFVLLLLLLGLVLIIVPLAVVLVLVLVLIGPATATFASVITAVAFVLDTVTFFQD